VPAAHFSERLVALGGRWVPVQAVPLRAQELAEGVARGKAHPDPVGAELLYRRGTEVLWLADSHGWELKGVAEWSQGWGAPGDRAGGLGGEWWLGGVRWMGYGRRRTGGVREAGGTSARLHNCHFTGRITPRLRLSSGLSLTQ
jgi:hypothetical protein